MYENRSLVTIVESNGESGFERERLVWLAEREEKLYADTCDMLSHPEWVDVSRTKLVLLTGAFASGKSGVIKYLYEVLFSGVSGKVDEAVNSNTVLAESVSSPGNRANTLALAQHHFDTMARYRAFDALIYLTNINRQSPNMRRYLFVDQDWEGHRVIRGVKEEFEELTSDDRRLLDFRGAHLGSLFDNLPFVVHKPHN